MIPYGFCGLATMFHNNPSFVNDDISFNKTIVIFVVLLLIFVTIFTVVPIPKKYPVLLPHIISISGFALETIIIIQPDTNSYATNTIPLPLSDIHPTSFPPSSDVPPSSISIPSSSSSSSSSSSTLASPTSLTSHAASPLTHSLGTQGGAIKQDPGMDIVQAPKKDPLEPQVGELMHRADPNTLTRTSDITPLCVIGHGGFGEVELVQIAGLATPCVLKKMLRVGDEKVVERCKKEFDT
ncbi:hypothetical protein ADUPG1_012040, partial [Aduncisulcus paluster]